MLRSDLVVTVRGDQEQTHRRDAPSEIAQQVQRCLVRPMHVLEDQQCWLAGRVQHTPGHFEHLLPRPFAREQVEEWTAQRLGNLDQWPEWCRRGQRVTASGENAGT